MESIRIGAGAAYAGDRIELGVELAREADLDYLVFECLAERTIAMAEHRQREDGLGYNELLADRLSRVIPHCVENDVTVITNMGAAAPGAAADVARDLVVDSGASLSVASVTGSDVTDRFDVFTGEAFEGEAVADYRERAVSIRGTRVSRRRRCRGCAVTGSGYGHQRAVADPSLFLAGMVHEFEWFVSPLKPTDAVGQGIVVGHLLECAGQLTGEYFADPGRKDVEDLGHLGFPYATVARGGSASVHSLPDAGGSVTEAPARSNCCTRPLTRSDTSHRTLSPISAT